MAATEGASAEDIAAFDPAATRRNFEAALRILSLKKRFPRVPSDAYSAAIDVLVPPLQSGAMIGGMEVRMMAVAAMEKIGVEASEVRIVLTGLCPDCRAASHAHVEHRMYPAQMAPTSV